jgi:hypothetical protein
MKRKVGVVLSMSANSSGDEVGRAMHWPSVDLFMPAAKGGKLFVSSVMGGSR